jgi:hypothetical protein
MRIACRAARSGFVTRPGEERTVGVVCQLVFQPVIRLIQITVSVVEWILVQLCEVIQQAVWVATWVLAYVCNTVVRSVCGSVCSVVCGICDFFCGIFGCDCGCENVCNNVCNVVTNVVCGWTYVLQTVLEFVARLICDYILQAIIVLLNLVEAFVTMVLTWVCTLIDVLIRWLLCIAYIAEIFDNTEQRRFRVAPKIVPNSKGYSDWFIYVNNPGPRGTVDQNTQGYILSDAGRPLLPVVDDSGDAVYYEVAADGDFITGELRHGEADRGYVPGQPLLYYHYKVIEIASHLLGAAPGCCGRRSQHLLELHNARARQEPVRNLPQHHRAGRPDPLAAPRLTRGYAWPGSSNRRSGWPVTSAIRS